MWKVCALHISRGTQQFAARNAVDRQTERNGPRQSGSATMIKHSKRCRKWSEITRLGTPTCRAALGAGHAVTQETARRTELNPEARSVKNHSRLLLSHSACSISLLFQSVGLSSAIALLVWHFGLSDNANRSIAQCSPCQCLLCGSRNSPARLPPDFRPCTCPCPYATTPQKGSILKINRLPKITCRTSGYWTRRI